MQKLHQQLRRAGYECEVLEGNMTQGQREQKLEQFVGQVKAKGKVEILV